LVQQSTIDKYKGKRFGRLTIIDFSYKEGTQQYFYKAKCDCGTERLFRISNIQQGTTLSCGCLGKEIRAKVNKGNTNTRGAFGESSLTFLINTYRGQARDRGMEYSLSREDFREITSSNCFYCDRPPSRVKKMRTGYGSYTYNGVDRVDNDLGYTKSNCVASCRECNIAKNSVTKQIVFRLYHRLFTNAKSNEEQPSTKAA